MPSGKPLLRFGVLTDPQYADAEPWLEMDRHYRNSLDKLREAIVVLNGEDLAFVVTLGDLVDRGWESFDPVLSVYGSLRHESILMPGNHDFLVSPERLDDVRGKLGMPAAWHDFSRGGVRFVVVDGNEVSLFSTPDDHPRHAEAQNRLDALVAAGAINAREWNGGIGEEQFAWLSSVLERARAADEKVVVMGHYPLHPENEHNLWDGERLTELFEHSGNVIAYLNGHNHAGNLGRHGSTWYVNFRGMVDTERQNTFAVVELHADRIEIVGHGREESRTLPL
ncbi:metallophosphoesterase [Rhizobium terrae]|uniref:metallophosphoesterase n=1 Tax=Rhizobium terrae TaxID=2171756 RepID=UPI000E3E42AC|nr:metallophosphoesterase [Rhizobium terrae]